MNSSDEELPQSILQAANNVELLPEKSKERKMHQCKVVLDNYNGQYFPGDQIQGRVLVHLGSQTSLRGIKVRLICHEHTSWMGTESYYDSEEKMNRTRDVQFQGDNDVINNELMLYGGRSGTTTLTMGQHIYPFSLKLPPNIPGSYQCEKGSIVYNVVAIVDRPMALDYEDQMIVVINSPIDLNSLNKSNLLKSSSYSDEKDICCCCCAQGPISLDVELPKKTLVPNETVEIMARVQNMSNTNVEGISLELRQLLTFKVDSPSRDNRTDKHILVDIKDSGVGAHGENQYNLKVALPSGVTLPNFSQCTLFHVEYVYKIVVHLPGLTSNLEIEMHPEVGHIPIGGQNNFVSPTNAGAVYPTYPNPTSPPYVRPPVSPPYGSAPPFGGQQVYPPMPLAQQNMGMPSPNMGWSANPSAPSAPSFANNPKAYEASQNQGYPPSYGQPSSEQPPPSYDSLRPN